MWSRKAAALLGAAIALVVSACASTPPTAGGSPTRASAPSGDVIGRTPYVLIARVGREDTAASLARRYLGDEDQAWRVAPVNGRALEPGGAAALALRPAEASPAVAARHVPILCYHRFVAGPSHGRMEVSAEAFEAQLKWLKADGWTVISFETLADFVEGRATPPPKAVVITIDDGYRSAFEVAYPLLKAYRAPATFFVYPDFIGSGQAMTWAQLDEVQRGGLIEVQSHSKSHTDMAKRRPGETAKAYADRVQQELDGSQSALARHLRSDREVFAYPFGATTAEVTEKARKAGYKLGVTVARGGNTAWSPPLLLRRDMIFGDDTLEAFKRRVQAAAGGVTGGGTDSEQ